MSQLWCQIVCLFPSFLLLLLLLTLHEISLYFSLITQNFSLSLSVSLFLSLSLSLSLSFSLSLSSIKLHLEHFQVLLIVPEQLCSNWPQWCIPLVLHLQYLIYSLKTWETSLLRYLFIRTFNWTFIRYMLTWPRLYKYGLWNFFSAGYLCLSLMHTIK